MHSVKRCPKHCADRAMGCEDCKRLEAAEVKAAALSWWKDFDSIDLSKHPQFKKDRDTRAFNTFPIYVAVDEYVRRENLALGYLLCTYCTGTGNEFYSMRSKCPECETPGRSGGKIRNAIEVWTVNDYEWWISKGPAEKVVEEYMRLTGLSREDTLGDDLELPKTVDEEELDRLRFIKEDQTRIPFRQELKRRILENDSIPSIFASTES